MLKYNMGFANDYLQSPRMAQDIAKIMGTTEPDALELVNKQMTCAVLRWQQWFENPFVDQAAVQMRPVTAVDFANYRNDLVQLFAKNLIPENKFQSMVNPILLNSAKNIVAPGPDFKERMVTLITTGACEYHGFNGAWTQSIKKNGLNPNAKSSSAKQFEPINRIFKRVGRPLNMERAKDDQNKIFVTPDPAIAYYHAEISPEWFYFFSNCNNSTTFGYNSRNYQAIRDNLLNFPGQNKLTPQDRTKIINFFESWWPKLSQPDNIKIAVMPMFRNPVQLKAKLQFNLKFAEKMGYEKLLDGLMYVGYEHVYNQAIKPEQLQIMDIPSVEQHVSRLAKLKHEFQQSKQALKTQSHEIQTMER